MEVSISGSIMLEAGGGVCVILLEMSIFCIDDCILGISSGTKTGPNCNKITRCSNIKRQIAIGIIGDASMPIYHSMYLFIFCRH
jgi:hypothetical protein